MSYSIWNKLDRFPPVLIRLLAKWPTGLAMTDEDIRSRSEGELSLADIKCLSFATNWDRVEVRTMKLFVQACCVDFADREQMRNANRYRDKDPKFLHLTRSTNFKTHFQPMLKVFLESQL